MLQTLLHERFGLTSHLETKPLPVYQLVVAKSGAKLKRPKPDAKKGLTYEGSAWARITSETTSTADLAGLLSERLARPVIDKTGIATPFALNMEYQLYDQDSDHPTLFTALQETLGLRLEPAKGPVEILVVDRIEKTPTEN